MSNRKERDDEARNADSVLELQKVKITQECKKKIRGEINPLKVQNYFV